MLQWLKPVGERHTAAAGCQISLAVRAGRSPLYSTNAHLTVNAAILTVRFGVQAQYMQSKILLS